MSHDLKPWEYRIQELEDKNLIDEDQKNSLMEMLASKDKENFTILEILIKDIVKNKLAETLNVGQKQAYYDIISFIDDSKNDNAIVLKGYAGTGKTFLIKRLIEYIGQTDIHSRIAISAPTNKAVKVLYKSAVGNIHAASTQVFEDVFNSTSKITYSTIHKLLGLREKITLDGKQVFEPEGKDKSKMLNYEYLIVDEVSMLSDSLCKTIMSFSDNMKIIFIGDPMQIPPIGAVDSIPFKATSEYHFKRIELTEIMRQKGDNPIVSTSFTIRNNINSFQPIKTLSTQINSKNEGIVYYDSFKEKDKIRPLLAQYFKTEAFSENSDYMKVIAWRNQTVNYINGAVREILFGKDCGRFEIGEKLIAQKPVFTLKNSKKYGLYWKLLLNTSDEFSIDAVRIDTYTKAVDKQTLVYKVYALDINFEDIDGDTVTQTISVIHEDSMEEYKTFRDSLKHLAKGSTHCTPKVRMKLWKDYFDSGKWSANVIYNYGISAHKSQGSTYKNVLILEDDIDCNKKTIERNRIKYTAYSRASELLHILRKN